MLISIYLLLASGLLEALFSLRSFWPLRHVLFIPLLAIISFSSALLVIERSGYWFVYLLAISSIYRLFNLYRADTSPITKEHLRRVFQKSAISLWLFQVCVACLGLFFFYLPPRFNIYLALLIIDAIVALVMLASTVRSMRVTTSIKLNTKLIDKDVPTLSVVIPARDESESLYDCLHSLLACDYPKLEVFVLDDHSSDRRTSEIVRSFAHDGVEFIPGKELGGEWVAKNWAYEQLLEVSNGELVLFCGADVRFEPESLRFLVSALTMRKKKMISVMPLSSPIIGFWKAAFREIRYGWELSLPRRKLGRPPVLSTCWVAKRDFLVDNGGFKGVSRKVSPESYFAKLALRDDSYSFFRYSSVVSKKQVKDQIETAIRLRYPQLHRRVEMVMISASVEIMAATIPIWLIIYGTVHGSLLLVIMSIVCYAMYSLSFSVLYRLTFDKYSILSYLLWPYVIIVDFILLHLSMYKYEFGSVMWKGRSISPPVMIHETQVTDSVPD